VADPSWHAVAGRARAVRVLVGGIRVVSALAAGWELGAGADGAAGLADAAGLICWDVSVDTTIARAHQHAAGARKRGICRPSRPVGRAPSRPIMRWAAPVAG
jgi:hypothetical protein